MPRNPHPERHVIVSEWTDIDAAPAVTDRDKQRVATIFSEQAWEHVVWLPSWVLDYSEKAWKLRQNHLYDGYPPEDFLPKSAVVVFERLRGVETIETPQQGLDAFAGGGGGA